MKESTVPTTKEKAVPETREETRTLTPPVDIFENDEGLVVVADLPGVEKTDVEVQVENNVLTIKAKAKGAMSAEPHYREYQLLDFFRQFQLSETVDQEHIKAELKNGVLMLELPKTAKARPRRIEVKVA